MEEADASPHVMSEREFAKHAITLYKGVTNRLNESRTDSNYFSSALRIFKAPCTANFGFPSTDTIRQQYGQGICALYIFKFHQVYQGGYTHGIHLRLNGFIHRRYFDQFIEELVKEFCGFDLPLKPVIPQINKNVALCDFLQTLYVNPQNLLVNFSHHLDAVSINQKGVQINNKHLAVLKQKMLQTTIAILDTMTAMPSRFQDSYLLNLLQLGQTEFRKCMRLTNINDIVLRIGQDAYNFALQDKKFRPNEIQELMVPLTKRAMLNRCITDKVTKQIQLLIQQTFGQAFVHPHPFNSLAQGDLPMFKPFDGAIFDPRFLFSVLLTARWFVRACMTEEAFQSNNRGHLMLYGGAGTGKSLIVSSIASAIPSYKYLVTSRFQNPEILRSSLMVMEEMACAELPSNQNKQILDLKAHVKVDFKNLNPENVTEGVPCMITTNDEVLTVLQHQRKYNTSSVAAALRRMYIIPMKNEGFEKMHGQSSRESTHWSKVMIYDPRFEKETNKLQRIFSLILGFSLFQRDIRGVHLDGRLHAFFQKLAREFAQTCFGTFYLLHQETVDEILQEVESAMSQEELDDSSYLVKVSTCTGKFSQLMSAFLIQQASDVTDVCADVIKDKQTPWPIKMYYLLSNLNFVAQLMWSSCEYKDKLNPEVKEFLVNKEMEPFQECASVEDVFIDLKEPEDSLADHDPFDADHIRPIVNSYSPGMIEMQRHNMEPPPQSMVSPRNDKSDQQ